MRFIVRLLLKQLKINKLLARANKALARELSDLRLEKYIQEERLKKENAVLKGKLNKLASTKVNLYV